VKKRCPAKNVKIRQHPLPKPITATLLVVFALVLVTVHFPSSHSLLLSPAYAQRFNPNNVWQQVYETLPDLPLENQYISRGTGQPVPDNTLIGRLIRYHIYIQGRPPIYRLDWKLTLADYLGLNEFIEASTYPSSDTLTPNPLEGDIAAIKRLNRAQRDALVQTIVDLFNSAYGGSTSPSHQEANPTSASPQPIPDSVPTPAPAPRLPQPGDANLLLP
jgi:hypothetical protein